LVNKIPLTADEKTDMYDFLKTLSDDSDADWSQFFKTAISRVLHCLPIVVIRLKTCKGLSKSVFKSYFCSEIFYSWV
jgi:hypothetical protein